MLKIGASLFAFALVVNRINSGFFSIAELVGGEMPVDRCDKSVYNAPVA